MYREATGGENLLPDSIKNESKRGFNVRDVARAHPWTESKCSACRWSRLVRFVFHSRLQGATNQRNSHNNKHQALSLTSASDAGLSMRLVFPAHRKYMNLVKHLRLTWLLPKSIHTWTLNMHLSRVLLNIHSV